MDKPEVTTRQLSEDELDQFLPGTEFWAIKDNGQCASRDERSEYIAHQRLQRSVSQKGSESKFERSSGVNVFAVVAIVSVLAGLVFIGLAKMA